MADKKISALTGATTPLAGTEVLPIVQSGSTVKVSVANLTAGRSISVVNVTGSGTSSFSGTVAVEGTGVTTGHQIFKIQTTGGYTVYGTENSAGNFAFPGSAAYSTNIGTFNNTDFNIYQNSAIAVNINGGNVKFNTGNLIQGTAAKGVNFTANTPAAGMTSQLLNWYEEGTWTPVLTPSTSGSITLTSPTNSMRYTRVGRLVTLTGLIDVASVSSPVGDLRLTGIPFNVGGSGAGSVSVYGLGTTSTATAYQVLVDSGSATTMFIRGYNAGSQVATVANNVQGGSGFYLTIQYTV
jgi:hypothetical protein